MRFSFFLTFILLASSFACTEKSKSAVKSTSSSSELNFPDKGLEEIIIYGLYRFADENRLKEIEEKYRNEGLLKENESLVEKYPYMADRGDEIFGYNTTSYCYNKTQNKDLVLDENLRARLYDKRGKLLAEDYLRFWAPSDSFLHFIVIYIPYHQAGHELRFVRLEGQKEILLENQKFLSQSELQEISEIDTPFNRRYFNWVFDEERECHGSSW